MIWRIFIVALFALSVRGQTNRFAWDSANRAHSIRDVVLLSDWTNSLRLWTPFIVAPTGSSYDVGDCSMYRIAVTQTNAASRPAWVAGAMEFDGVNDFLGPASRLSETAGTIIARFCAISNGAEFYFSPYVVAQPGQSSNYVGVFAANVPGALTSSYYIAMQAGPRRYNLATQSGAFNITTTQTVAWVHTGATGTIFVGGIQQPVWAQFGTNSDGWFAAQTSTSAVARIGSTAASGGFYFAGKLFWMKIYGRALSSSEVYRISNTGPTQ